MAVTSSQQLTVQPRLSIWRKRLVAKASVFSFCPQVLKCVLFSYFYSYSIHEGLCQLFADRIICCKLAWGDNLCRKKWVNLHASITQNNERRQTILSIQELIPNAIGTFSPKLCEWNKCVLWNYNYCPAWQTYLNKVFSSWHFFC